MIIRPATNDDRQQIAMLHTLSWQQSYRGVIPDDLLDGPLSQIMSERWAAQPIGDRDVVLVAEDTNGELAGFASTWVEDDGYIDNLHVRDSYRSQGLGRALLGTTARHLLDNDVRSAHLHVVAANHRARALYLRLGGQAGSIEDKDLYGAIVPNERIDWPDVAVLRNLALQPSEAE